MIVPKYRVFDDAYSVKENLPLVLLKQVEPQYSIFWDLIPFRPNLRQLKYDIASRSITPREVVLEHNILTGDTDIDITAATKSRVTAGHVLYHPATRQRFVLDDMSQTTGTANIRSVVLAPGEVRTQVDAGETLLVLSISEHFDEINAESRFESTSFATNYVQDFTDKLKWSTADLRELRKWGIDKKKRLQERMRDVMREMNASIIYNAPLAFSDGVSSMTMGFDYAVEQAGNLVQAADPGTADFSDFRAIFKQMRKDGVGPGDGIAVHMGVEQFDAYEQEGLAEINLTGQPGGEFVVGGVVKGMVVNGLDFIPFYADPIITDDRARIVSTAHAGKAYYQGMGEEVIEEGLRVVDEPSLSDSKVQVSTIQQKWGTVFENTDKVHYILETGITAE